MKKYILDVYGKYGIYENMYRGCFFVCLLFKAELIKRIFLCTLPNGTRRTLCVRGSFGKPRSKITKISMDCGKKNVIL